MKFHKTLKFRITLYYIMLLAITVLLFSILSYQLLAQRVSVMNLDNVQISVLEPLIPFSATPLNPTNNNHPQNDYKLLSSYVINADSLGEIQSSSAFFLDTVSEEGIFSINQKAFINSEMKGDQQIWLYFRPSAGKTGYYDLLAVTQSKEQASSILRTYKQVLYFAIVVTLIIAGVLGYLLIRRLLHPLGLITRVTREIREKDLDRKIEIKSQDELNELSTSLNQTFGRLQKSFEREHQFTSDTSHELRAPLAIMQGEASLALNEPRSEEEYRHHLESISEQISHMSSVVNKLLFLARSEGGKENLNPEDVDLKQILDDIIEVTRPFREEKNLILNSDLKESLIIKGDEVKLKELFLNLLDNAIKYTPPGGDITISSAKQEDMVTIIVQDSGIGISEDHLPHIFERFYRVNRADPDGGNGLGLAICKCIVELHKGRIEIESQPGKGSTFTVQFPLAKK